MGACASQLLCFGDCSSLQGFSGGFYCCHDYGGVAVPRCLRSRVLELFIFVVESRTVSSKVESNFSGKFEVGGVRPQNVEASGNRSVKLNWTLILEAPTSRTLEKLLQKQ